MGTSLTGNNISASYLGLLKSTDSLAISSTAKTITDGAGNDLPIKLSTNQMLFGTGSASVPALSFNANTSEGFYIPTDENIGVTIAGSEVARFNGSGFGVIDGTSSAPSLFFTGDTDTGLYRTGSGVLGISSNGTLSGEVTLTGFRARKNSTTSSPNYTFIGDDNTGLHSLDADRLDFILGGTRAFGMTHGSGVSTLQTFTTDELVFSVGGNEQVRIADNGSVGINNSLPTTGKLVVDGEANSYVTRLNGNTTTGQSYGLRVRAGTNTSDNSLLIENTSATSLLNVRGDGRFTLSSYGSGSFTGTATQRLGVDSSGNVIEIPIGGGAVDGSGTAGKIVKWSDTDTITDSILSESGSTITMSGGADTILKVLGTSTASRLDLQTDSHHRFLQTIESDGRFRLYNQTTSSEQLTVLSDGKLGISTTSPSAKLHVIGNTGALIADDDGTRFIEIIPPQSGNSFVGEIGTRSSHPLVFNTVDAERARIDSSGNLALGNTTAFGTTSNRTCLSVNGATDVSLNIGTGGTQRAFLYSNGAYARLATASSIPLQLGSNDTADVVILDSGNVGIGTTSPARPLSVNSTQISARFTSSSADSQIELTDSSGTAVLGSSSGAFLVQTGSATRLTISTSGDVALYETLQFFDDSSTPSASAFVHRPASNTLVFGTNSSERIRISSTGLTTIKRTGITGVTKNDMTLHIGFEGNNGQNNLIGFGYNGGNAIPAYIGFTTTSGSSSTKGALIFGTRDVVTDSDPTERMRILSDGNIQARRARSNTAGEVALSLQPSDSTIHYGFRIDSATNSFNLDRVDSAGNLLSIDASGNSTFAGTVTVGTGTVAAANAAADDFVITGPGTTSTGMTISNTSDSGTGTIFFGDATSSSAAGFRYNHNTGDMAISAEDNVTFACDNVGIGTTSPNTLLHINKEDASSVTTISRGGSNIGADTEVGKINFQSDYNGSPIDFGYIQNKSNNLGGLRSSISLGVKATSGVIENGLTVYGTSSGPRVGIGTASPTQKLEVHSTIKIGETGVTGGRLISGDSMIFQIDSDDTSGTSSYRFRKDGTGDDGTELMRLTEDGNFGLGTTNATPSNGGGMCINGGSITRIDFRNSTTGDTTGDGTSLQLNGNDFTIENRESGYVAFSTSLTEKARITSVGTVGINQTSPDGRLHITFNDAAGGTINVGARIEAERTNSSSCIAFKNPNGTVGTIQTLNSATSYNTSSDYRLKEDLQDFNALEIASKIKMYDFKWKADDTRSYGVMAHELQEVVPQAVSGDKDAEDMQQVDYSKLVPILLKSIQELEARVKELEKEI